MGSTKEETKHTPGEWTTDITSHPDDGRPVWAVDSEEYSICLLDAPDDAPNEANARLIAAAPTMLEVLREADQLLGYFHWDSGEGRKDKFEMVQKIRAAVNKALGNS